MQDIALLYAPTTCLNLPTERNFHSGGVNWSLESADQNFWISAALAPFHSLPAIAGEQPV